MSILLPVFNGERYLAEAVESVLSQTYSDLELLAWDDGSTDSTSELFRSYELIDSRVRVMRAAQRQGIVRALNGLIDVSAGTYLCRMDADDICLPERVEQQLSELQLGTGAVVVTCATEKIDEHGLPRGVYSPPMELIPGRLKFQNPFVHPTLFTSTALLKSFRYRDVPYAEDYDLICRLVYAGVEFRSVDKPLLRYRIRPDNVFDVEKAYLQNISSLWIRNVNWSSHGEPPDPGGLKWLEAVFDRTDFTRAWPIYARKVLTIDQSARLLLSILKDYPRYDRLTREVVRNSLAYRGWTLWMSLRGLVGLHPRGRLQVLRRVS